MSVCKPQFVGERVRLGELISKAAVVRCGNGSYPVYSMTMHDGIVKQAGRFKKTIASKDTSAYKVVKKNQLVVGFPIDEGVLYVQNFDEPGIMSPAYSVWDINLDRVLPDYLDLALHSPQCMAYYKEKMRGTTARRRTLTSDGLRSLEIPLPSIQQQHCVVGILATVKLQINHARSVINQIDSLVKSRFVEMFGDTQHEYKTLSECCDYAAGGATPSMKHGEYYDGEIPFIKSGDVKGDIVERGALTLTEAALQHGGAKLIPGDSVLVVTRSALLKRKLHVALAPDPVVINQDIKAFHPHDGVLSSYLMWAIRSREAELLHGVRSVNTSSIKTSDLFSLDIPLPSLALQQEFADFVAQVDKPRFVAQQQIEKLQMLYDSLAQEYFGD